MYYLLPLLVLCAYPLTSQAADVKAVYADYTNTLLVPPAVNSPATQATAGTFFGGHVKMLPNADGIPTEPSGGGYRLTESSFGQLAGYSVPYPDFVQVAVDHALKTLYFDQADDTELYKKDEAAFRYKVVLYERTASGISPNFATMESLWNSTTRARALAAANGIAAALRYFPNDASLRNALLDVLYDIANAEIILAKELEADALKAMMGFPGYISPDQGFAISLEIDYLQRALNGVNGHQN